MAKRSSKAQGETSQQDVLPINESGRPGLESEWGQAASVSASGPDLLLTLADGSTLRLDGALNEATLLEQLQAQLRRCERTLGLNR